MTPSAIRALREQVEARPSLRDELARIITLDHLQLLHDFDVDGDIYRRDPECASSAYVTADAILSKVLGALGMLDTEQASERPMEEAPKDGRLLKVLVQYSGDDWTPLEDAREAWTIGFNALDATGDDEWFHAGWDWNHDCFTAGRGTVIGWKPFEVPSTEKEAKG